MGEEGSEPLKINNLDSGAVRQLLDDSAVTVVAPLLNFRRIPNLSLFHLMIRHLENGDL
jgi:hypothetical protein